MNATNKLLEKWLTRRFPTSGSQPTAGEIAIELGVKRTSIANYRAELSQAAPHVISKMARDLGENEAAWLALVESERAKDSEDRKTWALVARRLGAAAAVATVALLAFPLVGSGHDNAAFLLGFAVPEHNALLGIMRSGGIS